MDIMDSSDTPTGGLDGTTASSASSVSSSGALPLSVDQRDDFSSSPRGTAGSRPTSSIPGESSSSTAFDRLDAVKGGDRIDEDLPNALPTSQDDLFYPQQELVTHPSLLSSDAQASLPRTTQPYSLSPMGDDAEDVATSVRGKATQPHSLSPMGDDAEDVATSVRAKASNAASSASSTASGLMDSLSNKLHQAGDMASKEYNHLKAEASARMPHASTTTSSSSSLDTSAPRARVGTDPEPTDTHPDAASMRDTHIQTSLHSLATHANEVRAPSNPHQSEAQTRGLEAAAAVEPKDSSAAAAGGGVMGALGRAHATLEAGVEKVKDRVDDWAEKHMRSSPKEGEHLSEAHVKDLPTLVDTSNEKNTDFVRAKMHPSAERAGANALPDKRDYSA